MTTLTDLPEIPITDLTTGAFNGTGVVDKLIQAVHSYIDHEFKEGRLKGPEYAQVCLGSIESAMQTGVTFLLQQRKAMLEAQLVEAQIRLANKQIEIAQAELAIKQAELPKVEAEVRVLNAQECKLKAEFDLTKEQTLKAAQETALLAQKVVTERAQTQSIGVDLDSVIGRQKALYTAQANGFKRDAEQKAAKTLIDTWNVRRTTDEGTQANTTNRLDDATIGAVVTKLIDGVNSQ